jgi:hypothetical protein
MLRTYHLVFSITRGVISTSMYDREALWYSYFLALRKKIGDLGRQHQRTAVVTPYELDNHLGRLLWQVFL